MFNLFTHQIQLTEPSRVVTEEELEELDLGLNLSTGAQKNNGDIVFLGFNPKGASLLITPNVEEEELDVETHEVGGSIQLKEAKSVLQS